MRVLVVDDSDVDFARCKAAFSALGVTDCAHIKDGDQVLEAATSIDPDVIMLDIVMDNVDGFEALANLNSSGFAAPIIMYSSKNQQTNVEWSLRQGAKGFLKKPITVKTLRSMLTELKLI